MAQLTVPASYWDDYFDRSPVDKPSQMAVEVKRAGNRVTIEANEVQLKYLKGDADFYADRGNTDDAPSAVVRGARRVLALCAVVQ